MYKEFRTVGEWFEWRDSKGQSVEDIHRSLTTDLHWECTDVLYSFLGIYTIGLLAFYPMEFYLTRGGQIRPYSNPRQRAYSQKFLRENHPKYPDLNECEELTRFLALYKRIGNVCPIWPGGNADRGKSDLYDLPDLYFGKYPQWTKILLAQYPEAHLNSVAGLENPKTVKAFLQKIDASGGEDQYREYLSRVCNVIMDREKTILASAKEQGISIDRYPTS